MYEENNYPNPSYICSYDIRKNVFIICMKMIIIADRYIITELFVLVHSIFSRRNFTFFLFHFLSPLWPIWYCHFSVNYCILMYICLAYIDRRHLAQAQHAPMNHTTHTLTPTRVCAIYQPTIKSTLKSNYNICCIWWIECDKLNVLLAICVRDVYCPCTWNRHLQWTTFASFSHTHIQNIVLTWPVWQRHSA